MAKKDFSRKIDVTNNKVGLERREDNLRDIQKDGTYLPKPIDFYDIDKATLDFINDDVDLEISGEEVSVFMLSIQKWSEFTRTWGDSDEFKDVKMPFITIVREPDIQVGKNQDGLFNVAGNPTFTYHKIPTLINGREGYDLYKIPQPTAVDLSYNVRFFTNRMTELNKIHNKIQRTFNAHQFYVNVLGHSMPIILESVSDESRIDDIESRRYYAINFKMVVNGYIINEEDFSITPIIDRTMVFFEDESNNGVKPRVKKNDGDIDITFKNKSNDYVEIEFMAPLEIQSILNSHNILGQKFILNGVEQEENVFPINISRGDILKTVIKRETNGVANLTIKTSTI